MNDDERERLRETLGLSGHEDPDELLERLAPLLRMPAPSCPVAGHLAPVPAPEFPVSEPEHRHVRMGGLEFCFRLRRERGWVFEGAFLAAVGHVVSDLTWRESFRIARAAVLGQFEGGRPSKRCPECGQVFGVDPAGAGPWVWTCGPEHVALSRDGLQTTYGPGYHTTRQVPASEMRVERAPKG